MRSADGREQQTGLARPLLSLTGVDDPKGLPAWAAGATKGKIAALSVEVARVARQGDPVAARVVHRALEEIRAHLETVLARTSGWTGPARVTLVGGLVRKGRPLREAVMEMVAVLGCEARLGDVLPERGALRMAMGLHD